MKVLICRLIVCSLTASLFLLGLNTASAATRVALMSGDGGVQIANVVDLAQVRLSGEPDLELLDRAHVRRVLEEQKLSMSGVVDASQAIAVGKLLSVDLIAVVESSPGKDGVPGVVIFDSQTGVRYWDAALTAAATELERAADEVVVAVRTAHRKRVGLTPGFQTVGIMTVRNADLPRNQDSLCETVGLLIERGLCRSPDLAVLERRRLAHVNDERSLPVAAPPKELLASLTTVDLEVSRAADGRGIKATALLKSAGKEQAANVTVTVPEANAALLSETLLKKLIEALHAAPIVATADSRLEARRFDGEAAHHYSHRQFAEAVRAADAAHALDPANEEFPERLSLYLIRQATYLFSPSQINIVDGGDWSGTKIESAVFDTLLAKATRGVEINSQLTRPSAHHPEFNYPLVYLCRRLNGFRVAAAPPDQEQINAFFSLCRRRSCDYIETWAAKAEADPRMLDRYMSVFQRECANIEAFSADTADYADTMYPLSSRWISVTKNWQPQFNTTNGGSQFNSLLEAIVTGERTWFMDRPVYARKMAPLFVEMQQHSRPVVRLYGLFGELRGDVFLGKSSDEVGHTRFATEYRKLAQEIITTPEPWDPGRTRFEVCEAWLDAIGKIPGKTPHAIPSKIISRELVALCDFLMSRNELRYKVVQQIPWKVDAITAFPLVQRMSVLVDSPQFNDVDHDKSRIRSLLNTVQQDLLQKHPELATGSAELPWSTARKIFDVSQFRELSSLIAPHVVGELAYGIGFEFEGERSFLRLVKISLTGGKTELLGRVDLDLRAKSLTAFEMNHFVPSVSLDGDTLYAATDQSGIVLFPLGQGLPRRIGTEQGLPSAKVSSVACLDGTLYAGVGDGYLISYDVASDRCEIVASSRRKQKLSPFDDRPPFRVPYMVRDPQRKRVVMLMGDGLWQIKPSDGKLSLLLDLLPVQPGGWDPKLSGSNCAWGSPLRGDQILLSTFFESILVDLRHDKAELIYSPDHGVFQAVPPHLLLKKSLWSAFSFARLSLDKREQQKFSLPGYGDYPFRATQCLELVGGGKQVLAGDERSLWLLDLNGVGLAAGKTTEGLKEIAQ